MSVRREPDGRWRFRTVVRLPDGRRERVSGTAPKHMNTKVAAQEKEREVIARLLAGTPAPIVIPALEAKEVPTVQEFVKEFMAYANANNKPAEIQSKEMILRLHLLPMFGMLRLDEVGERHIEAFKADRVGEGYNKKTINNHLSVLRRMLVDGRLSS
jgi:hypothetical protein